MGTKEIHMTDKVAIHTSALGSIESGGIRCIIYFLNLLKERGYDVCAFVDVPPYNSTWLESRFGVLPSNSQEYLQYDGILISPYTPTMRRVAEHKSAKRKIIWMHTAEFAFKHAGKAFMDEAIRCSRLDNVEYIATSHYVKIMLELIFERKVLPHLVPGGIDKKIFKCDPKIESEKLLSKSVRFCMLDRPEPLRGIQIGREAFSILKKEYGDKVSLELFANIPQIEMHKAYGRNHFFVDPSLLAGLPLPPLEAMACGTVPIVTHFGSNDYIIEKQNGFFINPNDIEDTFRVLKSCTELYLKHASIKEKNISENTSYDIMSTVCKIHSEQWTWDRMIDNFEKNIGAKT